MTIPNPGAYAEHFVQVGGGERPTDATTTTTHGLAGDYTIVELPKPRRHWRVTKGALEGRIAELEGRCETIAEMYADVLVRMSQQRDRGDRWKLIAQGLFLGCLLLGVAGWL